jgi:hypothetical protein
MPSVNGRLFGKPIAFIYRCDNHRLYSPVGPECEKLTLTRDEAVLEVRQSNAAKKGSYEYRVNIRSRKQRNWGKSGFWLEEFVMGPIEIFSCIFLMPSCFLRPEIALQIHSLECIFGLESGAWERESEPRWERIKIKPDE